MIHYRRDTNKRLDEIHNSKPFSVNNITTGGKAEGTALYFESDIDRLYAIKGITCVEPGLPCLSPTVLHLDKTGCSPGYTRVKQVHIGENNSILNKHLVSEQNEIYVANSFSIFRENAYMLDINGVRITKQEKSGPSAPYGNTSIKYDFVFGFECTCQDLIEKWFNRPRKYEWPGPRLIKHISTLEGHVVPVANKGSKFPLTEWRICFTKAELMLMHSLDECQTKLYILLKLIAKSLLKPLCSEMSSYIMKNIVFWIVETSPNERFSQQSLIDRLVDSLTYLKDCLSSNVLKSYMIAERNLFKGRITEIEKKVTYKEN
ncbi:uncharacterized protein LOC123560691 [Mercenaria mercenaria]|uniref:uncharacterized protein LOC123560691 n=1 Tax=Mercenaria mercenaria TaxID=6596 RepID=UPI00234E9B3D|nr:uncharacterized protein LOC123560691 [Mercenaria mercenaria]